MNFLKDLFGLAKGKKGDFEGSIADHTKAIELKPDLAAAYNRGNAKRAKVDLDGAIADYNKAIQLQPDYENDYDSIKALIASGADVNARSKVGRTALMWAADKGDADSIEALIASGAHVNAKDENGKTALMEMARTFDDHDSRTSHVIVEALIAAGSDVNARDNSGATALEIATSVNGFRGGDHSFECILARCFASILSGRSPFASGCAKAFLASPLFKPALTRRLSAGSCSHSSMNRDRSTRPYSRKARARPF